MDFMQLLAVANKNNTMNEKLAQQNKTGYSANLAPPKRQAITKKPKGVLSESVKAFLQKKEDEEKAIELEEKKKKEALLQLRKEQKNTRKANAMAKRTKDNIHKMEQTDEEKQREREKLERQKLEEKRLAMIEKLKESESSRGRKKAASSTITVSSSEPVSDKQLREDKKLMAKYDVSDEEDVDVKLEVILSDKQILDKDGYKAREEERRRRIKEEYHAKERPTDLKAGKRGMISPVAREKKKKDKTKEKHKEHKEKDSKEHKHKHKHKHKDKHKEKEKEKPPVKEFVPRMLPKPKFVRPNNKKNVLSFQDLLKMANDKQSSVLKPGAPGATAAVPVQKEPKIPKKKEERPMTKEEKDRLARKQTKEYKEWYQKGGVLNVGHVTHQMSDVSSDSDDEPAKQETSGISSDHRHKNGENSGGHRGPSTTPTTTAAKNSSGRSVDVSQYRDRPRPQSSRPGVNSVPTRPHKPSQTNIQPSSKQAHRPDGARLDGARSSGVGDKSMSAAGSKRDSAGATRKTGDTQSAHSNPFDRIMGQIKKNNPKPERKPRRIESDEESEYDDMDGFLASDDDDMDDFIDDSEATDVSSAIRDIFGYDKRKYKDQDDDLRDMDTGYAQIAREEARSAKIGRMEDLEDMRMEEEEKRRKLLMKKKMKLKMKGR